MPRATKPTGKTRHDPLLVQLREDELEAKYGKVSQPGKRKKTGKITDGEDDGETVIDPKTSRKIFELARDQQVELGVLENDDVAEDDDGDERARPRTSGQGGDEDEEEEIEEVEYEEYEIDAEDEFVSALHNSPSGDVRSDAVWYLANRLWGYAHIGCPLTFECRGAENARGHHLRKTRRIRASRGKHCPDPEFSPRYFYSRFEYVNFG